jgi:hypothetical protein
MAKTMAARRTVALLVVLATGCVSTGPDIYLNIE